jgi:hypothetical protein
MKKEKRSGSKGQTDMQFCSFLYLSVPCILWFESNSLSTILSFHAKFWATTRFTWHSCIAPTIYSSPCSLWFASSSIYAVCFLFHILAWYPDLEFVLKSKLLFWITSENQSPACIESAKSANLLALCIAIVIIYCRTSNYDSSYY